MHSSAEALALATAPGPEQASAGRNVYHCMQRATIRVGKGVHERVVGHLEKGDFVFALETSESDEGEVVVRYERGWVHVQCDGACSPLHASFSLVHACALQRR